MRPGEQERTCSGRYWVSSPMVPLTEVARTRPSMVRAGPWPQGRVKLADPGGMTGRRSARAGTASWDSLTGSVSSWPVEVTMVAWRTRGKDTSIRSVVSGGVNRTRPLGGMLAWRVPAGLVIFTVSGVDGRPAAGRTISDEMRRWPGQLRWMTGLASSAVHGTPPVPLIRLAGNPAGRAPAVEATLTCSRPAPGGLIRSSSASSPGPGRARAAACSCSLAGPARVKARAIGAVAAGSAKAAGDGTCWRNEKATEAACRPAGSSAGSSRRVTWTPGISTSEIPAPG